jgi:hypothetical protein
MFSIGFRQIDEWHGLRPRRVLLGNTFAVPDVRNKPNPENTWHDEWKNKEVAPPARTGSVQFSEV